MIGKRGSRWPGRSSAVALVAAGTLALGMSPAAPAPPGPSPSSSASRSARPSTNPRYEGRRSHDSRAVCVKGPRGRIVDCPARVPRAQIPRGARRTGTLTAPITDPATLVDTRTWTTGGGNTFPGADVPFGMVQWSPDTMPNRSAGGGYSYGDTALTGYSLTHVSGPGCGAAGDVPILPVTGALPSGNPNEVTTAFSNTGETAQAGYYAAQTNQPDTITSEFTATPHSSMARFSYPATTQAGMLIKLHDSQNGEFAASTASVVNDHEVSGTETSGHFCGEVTNDGQPQEYTVHFDLTFDRAFTASQLITQPGQNDADAVYLRFDTSTDPVVQAKVGISYVSTADARANWQRENPGWAFDRVEEQAQQAWNTLLGRIQVSGGDYNRTQMFYSLLYKAFVQPNISSDVNGQYLGADMKVHTVGPSQQDQYGMYSGWDTYHSLAQLQAMLDPSAASDQAQSLINYYEQDQILQQWGYLHLNNYVMVGDPAQSIIADYYAFGARDFDTATALQDMLAQATTTNDVRPGEDLEDAYGYLPEDGSYQSCCNPHGFVSSLLEYDSADLALATFAAALGDQADAGMLQRRANNWQNVFDPVTNLLTPRYSDGSFFPGVTATTTDHYVEGDAYQYLWDVPNNYAALFALLGGKQKAAATLRTFLSQPNGFGTYAQLTNEFGFGEQYALDYAGDPAGTQQAVNHIRTTMYRPGPVFDNNDDLGANSSAFVWQMLGMYPENSGTGNLVFNSPGFPHAAITLPNGRAVTINAPSASPTRYYVQSLTVNGADYRKLFIPYATLADGATLDWTLGTRPSSWGSAAKDAPPSYPAGTRPAIGFVPSPQVSVTPSGSTTVRVGVQNATARRQTIHLSASPPSALNITARTATVALRPNARGYATFTIHAPADTMQNFYSVPISMSAGTQSLPTLTPTVLVAEPGSLLRAFDNNGVSDDSAARGADFDGGGWSYSAQALAAQGVTPDSTVTVGDITYRWPPPRPGYPDNAIASGQQVTVDAPAGTQQLGFLGAATNGPSQGLAVLRYIDGSTARYWLGLSDWTLNGGSSAPAYGNQVAVTTPYRNCAQCSSGRDTVDTHVFAAVLPVDPAKSLVAVTLPPAATQGHLHVFAIGTSTSAIGGQVPGAAGPYTAGAGDGSPRTSIRPAVKEWGGLR